MSSSWMIRMGDYPAGFDQARFVVAAFQGMSMVLASDGFDTTFTVMLAAEDGTLPVEVTPTAFAGIAVYQSHTTRPEPLLVLRRRDTARPFEFVRFVKPVEAARLLEQLRASES